MSITPSLLKSPIVLTPDAKRLTIEKSPFRPLLLAPILRNDFIFCTLSRNKMYTQPLIPLTVSLLEAIAKSVYPSLFKSPILATPAPKEPLLGNENITSRLICLNDFTVPSVFK